MSHTVTNHNHLLLVPFLFVLLVFVNLPYSVALTGHPRDKKVLLRIKKHLDNPSFLSSWNSNANFCDFSWYGVDCDFDGRVNFISFHDTQDIHVIPPFLDQLPHLKELGFRYLPNLSGPIPSYIGKLSNLTSFSIDETSLTGPIPRFLGQLTSLTHLSLTSNKFTGTVPNFLHPLKKLTRLSLSSNLLTGPISVALALLPPNVENLDLGSNQLCGPIPNSIVPKLNNLHALSLDSNNLSGCIPTSLGLLPKLQLLNLSENQFRGSIPKSLGHTNLAYLHLSDNKLSGDASHLFGKGNTRLVYLMIAKNLLKFDFSNVEFAKSLGVMNISHNMIYGSLPKGIEQFQPQFIDVSYNQLCGPIPNTESFKMADPIIFDHNKCLCGGPLPDCN